MSYIQGFPDKTLSSLCDSFREYLLEIDNSNDRKQLADLFLAILRTAAWEKRKRPTSSENDAESMGAEIVDGEMPSGAAAEE